MEIVCSLAGEAHRKSRKMSRSRPPHFSARLCDERVHGLLGQDVLSERCLDKLGLTRDTATLKDFACKARFHRIPDYVSICLEEFYAGRRPLCLIYRIPEPQELLAMQADGARCVSALTSRRLLSQIYGYRDCFDMLLQDFAHMEKFVEAGRFWQQVGFFEFLHGTARERPRATLAVLWKAMGAVVVLCILGHECCGQPHVSEP